MNEKTISPEDLKEFSALAKDAQSIEDLITLREMAAEDYGNGETKIRVQQADGTEQEIPVTEVGRDEYAKAHQDLGEKAALAARLTVVDSVEDWRIPKQ